MTSSENIGELAGARAKAQAKFPAIGKDKTAKIKTKTGGEYSYDYADLATCFEAVRPALSENGLSVMQPVGMSGDVLVTTILAHSSGQWVSGELSMPVADKTDPRAVASAITYARRYGLLSLLGVAPSEEDDDGATAATKKSGTGYAVTAPSPALADPRGEGKAIASPIPSGPAGPEDGKLYVRAIQSKATKNAKVTRYELTLSTGEMVATINSRLAGLAEQACQDGRAVDIETKRTSFGTDLVSLKYADSQPEYTDLEPPPFDDSSIPF